MASGYFEKMLEIDLSTGEFNNTDTHMQYVKQFVGGRGLGAKLLWERLKDKPPGFDALNPENPLMFLLGPSNGAPIPGPSRITVCAKSPYTKPLNSPYEKASTVAWSCAGGLFAPELKMAGYDGVIFTGKADKPVYVVIDDDHVEIKDASHLWGKDCNETDKILRDEYGPEFKHMYIGPAGENEVLYASIMTEVNRAAGRSGMGCVMGSKNLKAVVVRGTKVVPVNDFTDVKNAKDMLFNEIKNWSGYEQWRRWGTAVMLSASSERGTQTTKNAHEATYEYHNEVGNVVADTKFWTRHSSCYLCPIRCMKHGVVPSGKYKGTIAEGPEYETGTMHGSNCYIRDFGGMMKSIQTADEMGLDSISAGSVVGFAMECYENGLLTKEDLGGIELNWGNADGAIELQKMIARKEGIGALLAQGTLRAAKEIGNGAEEYAMQIKGQEIAAWGIRVNQGFAIVYGTSTRGACHQVGPNVLIQHERCMCDILVICRFVYYGIGSDPLLKAFNAITGWNYSREEFLQVAERTWNLEKVFNAREGFKREDDYVPNRYHTPITYGPHAGATITPEEQEKHLDDYYTDRGWDLETSYPTEEKLRELGLDDLIPVIQELR
ncbi:aldehyde:ferredoxin oxidoreductase [Desulfitispora alkaliphila]|uniref:aldehyde ferredoxin oxidoreductase family protein n=1 Tax=Desulfitispora alkaliphila TaxID=622674 RepID=UPI003D239BCF